MKGGAAGNQMVRRLGYLGMLMILMDFDTIDIHISLRGSDFNLTLIDPNCLPRVLLRQQRSPSI